MRAVNVREEKYSQYLYEELPVDLIEEILAWLPAEYLCRFATVCQHWKALFSSTFFLRRQWAEVLQNKNPWLVVGAVGNNKIRDCWTYSSFTRSWKNTCLSLSFLEGKEHATFRYLGSGAGHLLIQGMFTHSIYVCNPVTAKYLVLPRSENGRIFSTGSIGIVEEGKDEYKVFVVHFSAIYLQEIVEIYDSTNKTWTTAGMLPNHLVTFKEADHMGPGTVFSGGYFYCLMVAAEGHGPHITRGIMGFNIVEGTYIFVPLPHSHQNQNGVYIHFNQLLHCGSRILFVQGIEIKVQGDGQTEIEEKVEVLTIWEFNKDAATNWKEMARKPSTVPRIFRSFQRRETPFGCAAIGDCLYFKKYKEMEVIVYNFSQNSWNFLPNCPPDAVTSDLPLFALTPRPDMKLE